jgi:hypothetical protein
VQTELLLLSGHYQSDRRQHYCLTRSSCCARIGWPHSKDQKTFVLHRYSPKQEDAHPGVLLFNLLLRIRTAVWVVSASTGHEG